MSSSGNKTSSLLGEWSKKFILSQEDFLYLFIPVDSNFIFVGAEDINMTIVIGVEDDVELVVVGRSDVDSGPLLVHSTIGVVKGSVLFSLLDGNRHESMLLNLANGDRGVGIPTDPLLP